MTDVTELLKLSPIVILVVALNFVAEGIKKVPKLPDWTIPFLLPVVGGIVYPFIGVLQPLPFLKPEHLQQAPLAVTVLNVLVGMCAGGISVWGNQAWRQWAGRANNTNINPPTT